MKTPLNLLPKMDKCLETIREICKDKNFSEVELLHRARILFLMNRLDFWEDFPVLLEEIAYQRSLPAEDVSPKKIIDLSDF